MRQSVAFQWKCGSVDLIAWGSLLQVLEEPAKLVQRERCFSCIEQSD
uniref:Uncharacterized protein n=1 Tax=Musa acuminata subsp. malaccensis TaxID=214687 RepID=A0A804I3K0_MUSAM